MALINCPGCNKEVSDKAKKCVHCGYEFELPKIRFCGECGNEIPEGATACINCGCPIEDNNKTISNSSNNKSRKGKKKIIILIVALVTVVMAGIVIYNVRVLQPRKKAEQNATTYKEAMELLEKGKYEDGKELLESIEEYKDVDLVLEQIKWESYVYECVNDFKQWLKNPDSFTLYEVAFYLDDESHGMYGSFMEEIDFSYPAIIFRSGAQNGFGGNTTGYELFYYVKDTGYTCFGSCDSLNEDDYYDEDGEIIDEEDGTMDVLLCMEINSLMEEAEQIGEVDMSRIKSVLKNEAYSTIKIIE